MNGFEQEIAPTYGPHVQVECPECGVGIEFNPAGDFVKCLPTAGCGAEFRLGIPTVTLTRTDGEGR